MQNACHPPTEKYVLHNFIHPINLYAPHLSGQGSICAYCICSIRLGTEGEEIHCLKEGGVAADARESIQRDTATFTTAMDTKLEDSDPFINVEEDEDELEEKELVLEDC